MRLVVDPHAQTVVGVEDQNGQSVGAATPLDALANVNRTRRKPEPVTPRVQTDGPNLVELAYQQYYDFKEE